MNYNININQISIIENGLDIDLTDAAIFDFFQKFYGSPHAISMQAGKERYILVQWDFLIKKMPILGITTRQGVYKRMDKLCEAGLIDRRPDGKSLKGSWFCPGDRWDLMFFKSESSVNESLQSSTDVYTTVNENLHSYKVDDITINNKEINKEKANISLEEKKKKEKRKKPGEPTPEICEVIAAWNDITGQDIKPTTEAHHPLINKRIREGYTVEDFKLVIQSKYDEWKDNPDMFIYIRPSTILNGHFEGYFNVAKMPKPKKTNDIGKFRSEAEAYENEYPEIHAQYITYLSYTTENFKNLLKSDCKILTFLEYYKYRTKTIYPAMNLISTNTAKDLMMDSHKDLNLDARKGNSVFDYFTKKLKEC